MYDVDMEDRTAVFDLALEDDSDDGGGLLDWSILAGRQCCTWKHIMRRPAQRSFMLMLLSAGLVRSHLSSAPTPSSSLSLRNRLLDRSLQQVRLSGSGRLT